MYKMKQVIEYTGGTWGGGGGAREGNPIHINHVLYLDASTGISTVNISCYTDTKLATTRPCRDRCTTRNSCQMKSHDSIVTRTKLND